MQENETQQDAKAQVIPVEKYLETGAHLGTEFKTGFMKKFIFRTRQDGLKIIDIKSIDDRVRAAAKLISSVNPSQLVLVSRRSYGQKPVEVMAAQLGARAVTGRFLPGLFTNPSGKSFTEPRAVMVTDPIADKQAVTESNKVGIPIIALCTTLNKARDVDLVIPVNNKGKQALALLFWGLTRQVLLEKGTIKDYSEFKLEPKDFEYTRKEGAKRDYFTGGKFIPKKKERDKILKRMQARRRGGPRRDRAD